MAKRLPRYLNPVFTLIHVTMTRLPFKMAYAILPYILTKGGDRLLKTKNMRRNIRQIHPDWDDVAVEALTTKMLGNFGRHIAEILHIASFKAGKGGLRIDYTTPDGTTFDGKGPAIYVGGHVGSWELLPVVFTQMNQPITAVYTQMENTVVDSLLMKQRRLTGATYVEKNRALKPFYQALDRGEAVALLVDQRVNQGLDVTFFGHPSPISRMPARLATNFDCPIIPFDVVRVKPGHLRVVFQDAIEPRGKKGKDTELALTQALAAQVEAAIAGNFEGWFCNKQRWKAADIEKIAAQRALADQQA